MVLEGTDEAQQLARRAERVAQWTNRARDLSNRPPNDLTPERLGERAEELAAGFDTLTAEVFDLGQIRAFAGDDIDHAKYYPEDDEYLLDREATVAHFDVAPPSSP